MILKPIPSIKKIYGNLTSNRHFFPILILVLALVIYNYAWDYIVVARIMAFNSPRSASVFDLGVFYYYSWTLYGNASASVLLQALAMHPIAFLLSPFTLVDNIYFFSFLQTAWLSSSAVPIYFVAFRKTESRLSSLILASSFLLYFGIAGINWFDVHAQSLFVPLFVAGYAFQVYGHRRLAALCFILSGLVRFPYFVFPLVFSVCTMAENWFAHRRSFRENQWLIWIIIILMLSLIPYIIFYSQTQIQNAFLDVHTSSSGLLGNLSVNLDNKIFTFLLLFAPFLMLPLRSVKWLILAVPYLFLLFFSGYSYYEFPSIILYQYWSAIVPFIYLGTIEYLSRLKTGTAGPGQNVLFKRKAVKNPRVLSYVLTIFVLVIMLGVVYEPYGPLNNHSASDFLLKDETNYNASLFQHFEEIVNLIPKNTPYVLCQNNMPEVIYRDPVSQTSFYGINGYPNNYTYFMNNSWTGSVKYILSDPYSQWFLLNGTGGLSLNMYETLQHFISTGHYGLAAEYDGIILLELNYTGSPVIYKPENRIFSPDLLAVLDKGYRNGSLITGKNLTGGQVLWYGPYTFLQPGLYKLTIQAMASNISSNDRLTLRYSFYNSSSASSPDTLNRINITGNSFSAANVWENITVNLTANNFLDYVEFAGETFSWNGTFSIRGIDLVQTGTIDV